MLLIDFVASASLKISEETCDRLDALVQQDLDEAAYQAFLEDHPALLDPLASSIVPKHRLGAEWETDFIIRRLDDNYIAVEIEKPRDKLFTTYPHPRSELSHALGQVLNWFAWLEDNIHYARNSGLPGVHSPRGIVVIGRKSDMGDRQVRMLKSFNDNLYPNIEILTYDDVISNSRNVVKNLTSPR